MHNNLRTKKNQLDYFYPSLADWHPKPTTWGFPQNRW